jgi:hypothetical protein
MGVTVLPKNIDLVGNVYGRLTVVEFSHKNARRQYYWLCRCECGKEKVILGNNLKNGNTKSCGCLLSAWTKRLGGELHKIKHGMCGTRTYNIWHLMIQRCCNQKATHYEYYGGRGIVCCEEWKTFANFFRDMGECPKGLTLDRIDNNQGYSKGNCRWATRTDQQNNMRNNRLLMQNGIAKTASQWAKEKGINRSTLQKRIDNGLPDEACLSVAENTQKGMGCQ